MPKLFVKLRRRHARSGMVYVLVLGMGTLVAVMVMGVLITTRLAARSVSIGTDSLQAEALAKSAVEHALTTLASTPLWRTTYFSGVETSQLAFGNGTISFKLVDEVDASLSNNTTDPVRLYGIGRCGKATKVYSLLLSGSTALTCLNTPLVANGNISVTDYIAIPTAGNSVATNGTFTGNTFGSNSSITGNLEAVGVITLNKVTVSGTRTTPVAARIMPAPSVFEYYINMGTPIPVASLTANGAGYMINAAVLSPTNNPFGGGTNPRGIYVIDCQNLLVTIKNSRIVGTLVILNPGANSCVGTMTSPGDDVSWVPAVTNYPCLLVRGNMTFSFGASSTPVLTESAVGANFNPPGTPYPYPGGATNLTMTDTYPGKIGGLVYVSGNATIIGSGDGSYSSIDMLMVGGTFNVGNDTVTLNYNSALSVYPPPGFTGGSTLTPVPGTCRWEPAP